MQSEEVMRKAEESRARNDGKKIVFVSGNFNIVHPGHVRLINFARSCGDLLVVGLFADGEPGVAVPYELRAEALNSMAAVHEIVQLQGDELVRFIAALRPHAVVKGQEHESQYNLEREAVKGYGGHLIFSAGDARFSLVDVIRREAEGPDQPWLWRFGDLATKHGLRPDRLDSIVRGYSGVRVMVLGDLIIDEYIHCNPLGMSQEDPTIVVTPLESQRFTGGAGIVAGHIAGLGGHASLLSIIGDDDTAQAAIHSLEAMSVHHALVRDATRPTILKQRFRAAGKTLLRVSHLRAHDAGEEYASQLLQAVEVRLASTDLLIFSDFNYGCLPQTLVDAVTQRCNDMGVPFVADSQASSQVGDVSRFKGAALVSATEREVRLAVNDFKSGIQNVANMLLDRCKAGFLIVKLGTEGLLVVTPEQRFSTSSLPALNPNPLDVAGAGDALLAAASLAFAVGASPWECAYLGSVAAGLQVARVGNAPLQRTALLRELEYARTHQSRVAE